MQGNEKKKKESEPNKLFPLLKKLLSESIQFSLVLVQPEVQNVGKNPFCY